MSRPKRLRRDDRGSALSEFVIISVVFLGFAMAIAFAGQYNVASAQVEGAARSAARTISMARNPHAAVGAARAEAEDDVDLGSETCQSMDFPPPVITPDRVTVTITCHVDLSAMALLELPVSRPATATAVEVIDRYREHP